MAYYEKLANIKKKKKHWINMKFITVKMVIQLLPYNIIYTESRAITQVLMR